MQFLRITTALLLVLALGTTGVLASAKENQAPSVVGPQPEAPVVDSTATEAPADINMYTLSPKDEAIYLRFLDFLAQHGDSTVNRTLEATLVDEEDAVPCFYPVEGLVLTIVENEEGPMYLLNIADTKRIDADRERTIYTDLVRALNPEMSEAGAAEIVDALFSNLTEAMDGFLLSSTIKGPWLYQLMHAPEPEAPLFMAMPSDSRLGELMSDPYGSETMASILYSQFRAALEEHGFALEPAAPAVPGDSSDIVEMMLRPLFEGAEWNTLFVGGEQCGYLLCIHDDSPGFSRREEVYALMISVIYSADWEAAQEAVAELLANAETTGEGENAYISASLDMGDSMLFYSAGDIHNQIYVLDKSVMQ